jgi:uncharacterized protein YegJ (DUF2314 family)
MYTLMDAKKQSRLYPTTFEVPTRREIMDLRVGDYVKLCFEESGKTSERMWVIVSFYENGKFVGVLDNQPFGLSNLKPGDVVSFARKHILSIM